MAPRNTRSAKRTLDLDPPPSETANTVVDVEGEADSGDEVSQGSPKRGKASIVFLTAEFEQRYADLELGTRGIVPGTPIATKYVSDLAACWFVKLIKEMGFTSIVFDLPKNFFPDLVREFYANLSLDSFGNTMSTVRGKVIMVNPPMLTSLLKIESSSTIDVFTSQGSVHVEGFGAVDQLKTILGTEHIMDSAPPTTTMVTTLTHLMFKLVRSHICPRLGNKSKFTCQDVVVVAMLVSGKPFNLASLILKKMQTALDKSNTGLPFGLLLTRIFTLFSVDTKGAIKSGVKEYIDSKTMGSNNLKIENGELVRIVDSFPAQEVAEPSVTAKIPPGYSLQADNVILQGQVNGLKTELADLKVEVRGQMAERYAMHDEIKAIKKMLFRLTGNKTVPAQNSNTGGEDAAETDTENAADKEATDRVVAEDSPAKI